MSLFLGMLIKHLQKKMAGQGQGQPQNDKRLQRQQQLLQLLQQRQGGQQLGGQQQPSQLALLLSLFGGRR